MSTLDLTPAQIVLLNKAIPDSMYRKVRKEITPGPLSADVSVRISGLLNVGADYQQSIAQRFPWQRLALVLASKVNAETLNASLAALSDLSSTSDALEATKGRVVAMYEDISDLTTGVCKGKVTGKPDIQIIKG